jgi:TPR repeat protein
MLPHMAPLASLFLLCTLTAQETKGPDKATLKKDAETAFQSADWPEAAKLYREVVKVEPKDGLAWHHLGYALHVQGKLDEALEAHLKAAEFPNSKSLGTYNAACVYALKKDKEKAFEWLKKAVEAGFSQVDTLEEDSDMDNLRDDPRFAEVVKAVKGGGKKAKAQAYVITTPRTSSRIAFFGQGGSPGQLSITYGTPAWKDEYAAALEGDKLKNKRWRLGADIWTTFDTNLDLEIGGVKVPANDYYCVAEWRGDDKFVLILLDPAEVRKTKLDAFQAHKTTGGIEIPLTHEKSEDVAKKLEIKLAIDKSDQSKGTLSVRYGPHELCAEMTLPIK